MKLIERAFQNAQLNIKLKHIPIMNKDNLYTARWAITKNLPIPSGGPMEEVLKLMEPHIGKLQGVVPPVTLPIPQEPTVPITKPRVALIPGHNARGNQGAWLPAPVNMSEFTYYNKIIDILIARPNNQFEIKKFSRLYTGSYASEIDNCYSHVNAWKPDFAMELHFNGGGGDYAMMICAPNSVLSIAASQEVLRVMSDEIGIPIWPHGNPRGIDQRDRTKNGGRSVMAAKCPAVLTEPFFGDHSQHAKRVSEIGFENMATIHEKAILAALKKIGKL
jgi:hypothetical protein